MKVLAIKGAIDSTGNDVARYEWYLFGHGVRIKVKLTIEQFRSLNVKLISYMDARQRGLV